MRTYPIPFNEEARLRSVFAVPGLGSDNDALFEAICEATRKLLDCPVAHISILEDDTQWYKCVVGMDLNRMPREMSFCAYTVMTSDPLVVPDLSADPRFKRHPMVAPGGPQARFYAGVPLVLTSGQRLGSLCALDLKPHESPSEAPIAILADLGRAVVAALEAAPPQPAALTEDLSAKQAFIALIGHELRTPLTILFGSLRLLEMHEGEPANPRLTHAARKSVEHLMALVETIIHFSDATTGEVQLNEQLCDLSELFAAIEGMTLPGASGALKTIKRDPDSVSLRVQLDPDHMKTALNAMALNAINHGGDQISVGAQLDDDGNLELWVSDNGRLEDHVDLARLYEPFVVGGAIKNRDTRGGLGLGLPLTRKLVELHGGDFLVRTTDTGTRAVIRLPVWRTEIPEPATARRA